MRRRSPPPLAQPLLPPNVCDDECRWLVGEQNRGGGGVVRQEFAELRKDRELAFEKHRQYGQSLKTQMREQMARDKMQCEMQKEHNLQKYDPNQKESPFTIVVKGPDEVTWS